MFGAVIPRIEAGIIERLGHDKGACAPDGPGITTLGVIREGAQDINLAPLLSRKGRRIHNRFGKVLIFTVNDRNRPILTPGSPDYIERDPDINAFLSRHENASVHAIAQRPGCAVYAPAAHRKEPGIPFSPAVRCHVVSRDTGIVANLANLPALRCTHLAVEGNRIKIGPTMPECFFGPMKQVLGIEIGDGAGHVRHQKIKPRRGPFPAMSDGEVMGGK